MHFTFYIVDAFVNPDKPFSGNPAAVVILANDSDISDQCKQNLAAQFNQCETVFVSRAREDDRYLIRWFTPWREIELCGHATMAASYILYTEKNPHSKFIEQRKSLQYRTKYGDHLEVAFDGQYVTLDFPSNEPVRIDPTEYKWLPRLQQAVLNTSKGDSVVEALLASNQYILLHIDDHIDIEQVQPNFDQMLAIDNGQLVILVIITQKSNFNRTGAHFTSRVFVPWVGVNEDPACGSALTLMTPYWDRVYRGRNGEELVNGMFHTRQMSKRGGFITSKLVNGRVIIGGQVRLFSKGQFHL